MNFVRRKATTSNSKHKPADYARLKEAFLNDVVSVVTMERSLESSYLIGTKLGYTWSQHLLGPWSGLVPKELKSLELVINDRLRLCSVAHLLVTFCQYS